jgi:hypothetical protein
VTLRRLAVSVRALTSSGALAPFLPWCLKNRLHYGNFPPKPKERYL